MRFIDDYRLLAGLKPVSRGAPPSLALMDTRKDTGGVPLQTLFHLSPYFRDGLLSLLMERGAHEPSPEEFVAPFYRDPSQRIIALDLPYTRCYPVVRVGSLLELLEDHEGSEVGWDEWKSRLILPSIYYRKLGLAWVSGSRLFVLQLEKNDPPTSRIVSYDFSVQGCAKHLSEETNADLGGVKYLSPAAMSKSIPYDTMLGTFGAHDSFIFSYVSVTVFRPL